MNNKNILNMLKDPAYSKEEILRFLQEAGEDISDEEIETVVNSEIGSYEIETINSNDFKLLNLAKLDKDTKASIINCPTKEEARYLQDIYYQCQRRRIALQGQMRAIHQGKDTEAAGKGSKNMQFMEWYLYNTELMETQIAKALALFTEKNYLAKWASMNIGIGPTIATCLCANLELRENTHASSWWDYCGLNDNRRPWLGREASTKIVNQVLADHNVSEYTDELVMELSGITKWKFSHYESRAKDPKTGKWSKSDLIKASSVIPYNKNMKVLMYKIGHSFLLCKNKPDSLYGRLYKERFDLETAKNENGDYADQAAQILATKNFNKSTDAYKAYSQGKLPKAHIMQRCQRYVTKLFISHLYEAAYWNKYGKQAPLPYALCFLEGHSDYIGPEVPYGAVPRDVENL